MAPRTAPALESVRSGFFKGLNLVMEARQADSLLAEVAYNRLSRYRDDRG